MAKHMREVPPEAETTRTVERTRLRRRDTTSLPYGDAATYRYSYPTAVPTDDDYYYEREMPARGGLPMLGRGVLLLGAWALRLAALMVVALLVANVLALPIARSYLLYVTDTVSSWLPWTRFGTLSLDTPFSGVFRGDFALMALALFVLDWALCRLRLRLI